MAKRITKPKIRSGQIQPWDLKNVILSKIHEQGGWVNAHAHLDRAYTITFDNLVLGNRNLTDKWKLVDDLKRSSSVEQIYDRMAYGLERQIAQGVSTVCSFIDVDEVIKDKAIKAAEKIRTQFNSSDFQVLFVNQTLKGVIKKEAAEWFKIGAHFADIVGGLPGADRWFEEEHIETVIGTARAMGKLAHLHIDQQNTVREKESEILAQKTMELGMQNRVVAIHGISLAAQPYEYRRKIYRLFRQAGVMLITCPTAWIDGRRNEDVAPTHNSIAPVEEMIEAGLAIGLGTDNIADMYKPFTDGEMWTELRFLLESCHFYDVDKLVEISTINGRKVLGLT